MARIDYPFDDTPESGQTAPVAPGVTWLRMPLPIKLNHINLWMLDDGDDVTIVDTGMHTEDGRAAWSNALDGRFDRVNRVIVTHLHPDHVGNAGWLTERANCSLWMTREEYMLCRLLAADTGRDAPDEALRFYRAAGFSDEQLTQYQRVFGFFGRHIAELPEAYHRVCDGDVLSIGEREWRVVIGRGHSPEHACLYDEANRLLIGGDQLLPTISSNVSVYPTEPDANPLDAWLSSIERLKAELHPDVLVLPAHGRPFTGAHARLDALAQEHERGLSRLLDWLAEPKRAIDCFEPLFGRGVGADMLLFATGEAIAHLNYLCQRDLAVRERIEDVLWYREAGR